MSGWDEEALFCDAPTTGGFCTLTTGHDGPHTDEFEGLDDEEGT